MNISFSATTEQVRQHQKHVTRRIDKSLRLAKKEPGDILQGIERGQGIKKGEHIVKLDQIVILEVNREPLDEIIRRPFRKLRNSDHWKECMKYCGFSHYRPSSDERTCGSGANLGYFCGFNECPGIPETTLEGFPELTPVQFVETFCNINKKCTPDTEITRILFDYVEPVKGGRVPK